jgi:hypothetical protein
MSKPVDSVSIPPPICFHDVSVRRVGQVTGEDRAIRRQPASFASGLRIGCGSSSPVKISYTGALSHV